MDECLVYTIGRMEGALGSMTYGMGTTRRVALIEPDFPAIVYSIMLDAILWVCGLAIAQGSLERGLKADSLIQLGIVV
jgi:hypothetical protein